MLFGALARGKQGDVLSVGNYGELEWRSREWKKRAHHRPLYESIRVSFSLRFSVIAAAWMQFAEFDGQIASLCLSFRISSQVMCRVHSSVLWILVAFEVASLMLALGEGTFRTYPFLVKYRCYITTNSMVFSAGKEGWQKVS